MGDNPAILKLYRLRRQLLGDRVVVHFEFQEAEIECNELPNRSDWGLTLFDPSHPPSGDDLDAGPRQT